MADETTTSANGDTGAQEGGKLTTAPVPETEPKASPEPKTTLGADPNPETPASEPEAKPEGPPESYEDFKLPEGVEVNKELMDAAKAEFKEMGLSQEKAQKAMDLYLKKVQSDQEAFSATRKEWVAEIKQDKEFGGEKFPDTQRDACMALRKFDPDGSVLKLLEDSGFGDNPAIIKMLARVQRALGEDEVHTERSRAKGNDQPLHERIYGKDGMGPKPVSS